jgi:hypothetical protein
MIVYIYLAQHAGIYVYFFRSDTLYLLIIVIDVLCVLNRGAGCFGVHPIVLDSDVVL